MEHCDKPCSYRKKKRLINHALETLPSQLPFIYSVRFFFIFVCVCVHSQPEELQ